MSELPPLDDELEGLLAPARKVPAAGADRATRIRDGVHQTLGGPAALPEGTSLSPWTSGIGGLLLGAGLGVTITWWALAGGAPPEVAPEDPDAFSAAQVVAAEVTREDAPQEDALPLPVDERASQGLPDRTERRREPSRARMGANRSRPSEMQAEPVAPSDGLNAERRLLDAAVAAVGRRHAAEALHVLDRYSRAHSNGQLREEADALRIRALAQLGRTDEARSALRRFEREHSGSLLLAPLRRVLSPEP